MQEEKIQRDKMERLFKELIEGQKEKMLAFAQEVVGNITEEDLLQPQDYPALENHPYFRYEEGVLEGLLTAQMAINSHRFTL